MGKRLIRSAYLGTIIFLLLMISLGIADMIFQIQQYGWIYEKTIIIGNYVAVEQVNISLNMISFLFLLWMIVLLSNTLLENMEK